VSHPTTLISSRLADRVSRQAGRLVREARRAQACEVEGIHQTRVASRRLRETLAIATGETDGGARDLARDARRIGRVLGPLRELDVSGAVWREPRFEVPWAPTLLTRLDRAAEQERAKLVPEMRATLEHLAGPELQQKADDLAAVLASSVSDVRARTALARSVRNRSRALDRALERAGTLYAPEVLHEVRIAAKKFRYALELVDDLSRLPMGTPLRRLKAQQDLLGRLHDLHVVQERLQRLGTERGVSRSMLRAVKAAATDLEGECRAIHARFVAGLGPLREIVARARAAVEFEHVRPKPGRMPARRTGPGGRADGRELANGTED